MTGAAGAPAGSAGAAGSSSSAAERVVAVLRQRGQSVATAESLTGGLVGATITGVPGASAVYRGGLITYATELKADLAGVDPTVLDLDGPVAASAAEQLAVGAARVCTADWGLATTGVAGPEPQDGHPVGLVFVAVAGPRVIGADASGPSVEVRELKLAGDRAAIRAQTVVAVLELLLDRIEGLERIEGL